MAVALQSLCRAWGTAVEEDNGAVSSSLRTWPRSFDPCPWSPRVCPRLSDIYWAFSLKCQLFLNLRMLLLRSRLPHLPTWVEDILLGLEGELRVAAPECLLTFRGLSHQC